MMLIAQGNALYTKADEFSKLLYNSPRNRPPSKNKTFRQTYIITSTLLEFLK